MALPRNEQVQYLSSTISTSGTVSRTTGSQVNQYLTFLCLWRMTSFSGTALQRSNWCKCGHLLRDLATTADLPPYCAPFSRQLLELTHR